jgi:hypothetical protein
LRHVPTCWSCERTIEVYEVADGELYGGERSTICADCATAATGDLRKSRATYGRERTSYRSHDISTRKRSRELPATTAEVIRAFCEPCASDLERRGFARYDNGRGSIKWMARAQAPVAKRAVCAVCGLRRATLAAHVRTSPLQ